MLDRKSSWFNFRRKFTFIFKIIFSVNFLLQKIFRCFNVFFKEKTISSIKFWIRQKIGKQSLKTKKNENFHHGKELNQNCLENFFTTKLLNQNSAYYNKFVLYQNKTKQKR